MRTANLLLALALATAAVAQDDLLFYLPCDEGQGAVAQDAGPHGLSARVQSGWAASPRGSALSMDGTAATVTELDLPPALRLGDQSWTFAAWMRPSQFTIDDRQNQRRFFSYGVFPTANYVLDLNGDGTLGGYFCHTEGEGTKSFGLGTNRPLVLDEWVHVAVVFDRAARRAIAYVNGFAQGGSDLPADFAGDFDAVGNISLGAGWHNYWGLMDDIYLYRRALSRAEVRALFTQHNDAYGVVISDADQAAERREALLEAWAATGPAAAERGDWAAVAEACAPLVASADLSAAERGAAALRQAQCLRADGQIAVSRAMYAMIAGDDAYEAVHRREAVELAIEIDREAQGLRPRDPAAPRTPLPRIDDAALVLNVAPDGDDAADGQAAPVASLARARGLVRAARAAGQTGTIVVQVGAGEYQATTTLTLGPEDSGAGPDNPTVWRGAGRGQAIIYGGQRLTGFAPVTDAAILARLPEEARGQVQVLDLAAAGVTDLGQLAVRGFAQPPSPPTVELWFNGQPMTLARWPNTGFVPAGELVQPGNDTDGTPSILGYVDPRHERWTQAEEPWLFGYFRFLWADGTIQLSAVDPATKTLRFDRAYRYGQPGMDPGQGIQYYAFNLLEEIDQPGEWYLDRTTSRLYFWPPSDPDGALVELGEMAEPMVVAQNVSDVRFEGLAFDLGRYDGLVITDCTRFVLAGCQVSRVAGSGVLLTGGQLCAMVGCDITLTGRNGSSVTGGDRATLTPAGHWVENCHISHVGRIDRTYTPAILLEGVGNRVAYCLLHDAPSSVMRVEGNDHVVEYCVTLNAVTESDDQGAMEAFGNASYRGNVYWHNRYINIGKSGTEAAVHGQAAIRFDDAISGNLVYGCVFEDSANGNFGAIQMNSGRDNVMDGNLFCDNKYGISGGYYPGNHFWQAIRDGTQAETVYLSELYMERYPQMRTMMEPGGLNFLWRNAFLGGGQWNRGNPASYNEVFNAIDPDGPRSAVAMPMEAMALRYGFRPIPLDEMGLYTDHWRPVMPRMPMPGQKPDWRAAQ